MILLSNLAALRKDRGITRPVLSRVTGLDQGRLRDFETGHRAEPWFDEACLIARALCLPGVVPLISCQYVLTDLPPEIANELDAFRAGSRLPLSVACRISLKLGLSDPMQLEQSALHVQVWDVIANNERGAEPGECPWCLCDLHRDEPHLDTCLPQNLFGFRAHNGYALTSVLPPPGRGRVRGQSRPARGLRAARISSGMTQAELSRACGGRPGANYLARMERCDINLTPVVAKRIAHVLHIDEEALFE